MRDKAEAQQLIKETAIQLFLKKGFEKTTMRAIAAKSKVPLSSIYYYYPNKEAIFDDIFSGSLSDTFTFTELLQNPELKNNILGNEYINAVYQKLLQLITNNREITIITLSNKIKGTPYEGRKEALAQTLYTAAEKTYLVSTNKTAIPYTIKMIFKSQVDVTMEAINTIANNMKNYEWVKLMTYKITYFMANTINQCIKNELKEFDTDA